MGENRPNKIECKNEIKEEIERYEERLKMIKVSIKNIKKSLNTWKERKEVTERVLETLKKLEDERARK